MSLQSMSARKPILGLLLGTALLASAWWIDRERAWVPLSVESASLLVRQIDTSIVLPGSGRFQLVHELSIPPGTVRGPLPDAGPLVAVDGVVAGGRWSATDSGSMHSYSGPDAVVFILGSAEAKRGDTLRLTLRANAALKEWVQYTPRLEVRRDPWDPKYAWLTRNLIRLAGLIAIALSGFAYWRALPTDSAPRPVGNG